LNVLSPTQREFRSWLTENAMHNVSAAKTTGLCLSAIIDQHCFEGMLKPDRDNGRDRKIILKLPSRTPSLLQDCASLPATSEFNYGIRAQLQLTL
jgi:hypothetical protein